MKLWGLFAVSMGWLYHPTVLAGAPVEDVSCDVEVHLLSTHHAPTVLVFSYQFKAPDKMKISLFSRRAYARQTSFDFFLDKLGMVYILNGRRLISYQPFLERIRQVSLEEEAIRPLQDVYGTGDLPRIEPYVAAALNLSNPANYETSPVKMPLLGGHLPRATEMCPSGARKYKEPHEVVRYVYYYDAVTSCLQAVLGYNSEGQLVTSTMFDQFITTEEGKVVALECKTEIAEGTLDLAREMTLSRQEGRQYWTETWKATLPVAGRLIYRTFQWSPVYHVVLPQTVEVYEQKTNRLLMSARFSNYRFNAGLEDALFDYTGLVTPEAVFPSAKSGTEATATPKKVREE